MIPTVGSMSPQGGARRHRAAQVGWTTRRPRWPPTGRTRCRSRWPRRSGPRPPEARRRAGRRAGARSTPGCWCRPTTRRRQPRLPAGSRWYTVHAPGRRAAEAAVGPPTGDDGMATDRTRTETTTRAWDATPGPPDRCAQAGTAWLVARASDGPAGPSPAQATVGPCWRTVSTDSMAARRSASQSSALDGHQLHAPEQGVGSAPGHATVDQGVENHSFGLAEPGHDRDRERW